VKYESLGSKSKVTWGRVNYGVNDIAGLRARLTSNAMLLTAVLRHVILPLCDDSLAEKINKHAPSSC
jgi:hypothetical protein